MTEPIRGTQYQLSQKGQGQSPLKQEKTKASAMEHAKQPESLRPGMQPSGAGARGTFPEATSATDATSGMQGQGQSISQQQPSQSQYGESVEAAREAYQEKVAAAKQDIAQAREAQEEYMALRREQELQKQQEQTTSSAQKQVPLTKSTTTASAEGVAFIPVPVQGQSFQTTGQEQQESIQQQQQHELNRQKQLQEHQPVQQEQATKEELEEQPVQKEQMAERHEQHRILSKVYQDLEMKHQRDAAERQATIDRAKQEVDSLILKQSEEVQKALREREHIRLQLAHLQAVPFSTTASTPPTTTEAAGPSGQKMTAAQGESGLTTEETMSSTRPQAKATTQEQAGGPDTTRTVAVYLEDSEECYAGLKWTLHNFFNSKTDLLQLVSIAQHVSPVSELGSKSSRHVIAPFALGTNEPNYLLETRSILDRGEKCITDFASEKNEQVKFSLFPIEASHPDQSLLRFCKDENTSLLVLCPRKTGKNLRASKDLYDYICHEAECPVLVVRTPSIAEVSSASTSGIGSSTTTGTGVESTSSEQHQQEPSASKISREATKEQGHGQSLQEKAQQGISGQTRDQPASRLFKR